ncbi:MAG TPA: PAS domain S-box protein [Bryobacteraceae bacterium]|jgi:PAS domain S-box-containing protein|nr:PAS domain S-box protein [Bryobacteraceae bacterium]
MPFRKFGDAHEAALYRNLIKSLPDYAIFGIDPQGIIESWNTGVEKLLGYAEAEFLGQPFDILFPAEDRQSGAPRGELDIAASRGRSLDERWHLRKDGTVFFADGMVTAIINGAGEILGYTKVMRDVTERRLAAEARDRLAAQVSELAHALDLTHTIIREVDGTIVEWTRGSEFLYGWSSEEAQGRRTHDLLQTRFPEPLENINQRLLEFGEWQGELTHRTKDGKTITVASHWVLHSRNHGTAPHVIEVNNDISEMKSVHAALERANAELSSFAYEVAHDIQSPLRRINNFAELLSNSLGTAPLETQKHLLSTILESAETLNQLISSLLQYATVASVPEDLETVPLDEMLNQVRRNLQPLLEETEAQLSWDPLPEVVGHSARLLRLLQNLVGNAVKYSRPGIPPLVHIWAERHKEECVIHVRDNGMGIDPRFAEAVFTPLKRLHGPEIKGSGLGLAICKRIVEGRGGRIWVDSTPGEGSTFHFTWPARF